MNDFVTIQDRINGNYADLSDRLKVAAEYVADNQLDVATRSLRSIAASSGVSPATYSRLARALGYEDYEEMREAGRFAVQRKFSPFSERALKLREMAATEAETALLAAQSAACVSNIGTLQHRIDPKQLEGVVTALHDAPKVLIVGSKGSAGIVEYFCYMAQWFQENWRIAGRNGSELAPALSRLGAGDVLFALTKEPYAQRTIAALKSASDRGITTIVVTDSRTSPALEFTQHGLVVATESPQFFSSYAATLVLLETIISLLLSRTGPEADEKIRAAERQIERLEENWTS